MRPVVARKRWPIDKHIPDLFQLALPSSQGISSPATMKACEPKGSAVQLVIRSDERYYGCRIWLELLVRESCWCARAVESCESDLIVVPWLETVFPLYISIPDWSCVAADLRKRREAARAVTRDFRLFGRYVLSWVLNYEVMVLYDSLMGLSKTEVNLRRLLAAAPQQQNQAKLMHYLATLREQLEQLGEERGPERLPRVSKGKLSEYSGKVEAIAAKLAEPESESSAEVPQLLSLKTDTGESTSKSEEESVYTPKGLRRRILPLSEHRSHDTIEDDNSKLVKLDAAAWSHLEKHSKAGPNIEKPISGTCTQEVTRGRLTSENQIAHQVVRPAMATTRFEARVDSLEMSVYSVQDELASVNYKLQANTDSMNKKLHRLATLLDRFMFAHFKEQGPTHDTSNKTPDDLLYYPPRRSPLKVTTRSPKTMSSSPMN
ncbi:hypothetical protein F511_17562 [Dorcoceras hygrometricum]|uniref:Uncharacterized protein n=1 Tax=Dorcoceras hygrometricum TaxID=472368 RepID=A0A2Z7CE65_9LAMI|nr:hypothetical protein F511_17562 [Dorcoceras hygrometricum]